MDNTYRILAFSALGLVSIAGASGQNTDRPNIIWVMAEDMGQDLECYGMPAVRTPVLNRMAQEGVRYDNACCSCPISSPSRSAMMTGIHQTLINSHNHRSNRDMILPEDVKPITYYLRQAGYTCILGNSNVMNKGRKTDCNFKHTPVGEWNGVDQFGLFDKFDEFTPEDQPFFAQIQLNVTHRGDWWKQVSAESPHRVNPDDVVLPPYLADHPKIREEWASYLDQVEHMDMEMGMILDELRKKGMYKNTVIFFIGDNGRCEIKGKGYLYDPGTKIPMIAWGKGIPHTVVDDIVSTLDISATILDMAGAEMPDNLSGKPLFKDGQPTKGSEYFYAARDNWDEVVDCMRSISTKDYTYIRNYLPEEGWDRHQLYLEFHRPAVHVMRTLKAEGKLNEAQLQFFADHKPAEELYDIHKDPHQLHNLVDDPAYGAVLQQMRGYMEDWQSKHRDTGLEDRNQRNPGKAGKLREWVQQNYPEEWKKLTEGEICDSYQKWSNEMTGKKKKEKKVN